MKSVKLLLMLSISGLISIFNIVAEPIEYSNLFSEAYAIVGDDSESKIDRDKATPLLIASYAALTPEQATAKKDEVESLSDGSKDKTDNVQAQLAIVAPKGRAANISNRVKDLKVIYKDVLAK